MENKNVGLKVRGTNIPLPPLPPPPQIKTGGGGHMQPRFLCQWIYLECDSVNSPPPPPADIIPRYICRIPTEYILFVYSPFYMVLSYYSNPPPPPCPVILLCHPLKKTKIQKTTTKQFRYHL